MKGRTGAFIADAVGTDGGGAGGDGGDRAAKAAAQLEKSLFEAALTFRANGGARGRFLEAAAAQAARAYGAVGETTEAQSAGASSRNADVDRGRESRATTASRARGAIPSIS